MQDFNTLYSIYCIFLISNQWSNSLELVKHAIKSQLDYLAVCLLSVILKVQQLSPKQSSGSGCCVSFLPSLYSLPLSGPTLTHSVFLEKGFFENLEVLFSIHKTPNLRVFHGPIKVDNSFLSLLRKNTPVMA